jgi:hypothetical protein
MKRERWRVAWQALRNAATDWGNLGVSAAAGVGGLLLQFTPLLVLAAAGYVTSVTLDLGRSEHWRQAQQEVRRHPPKLPDPADYEDPGARELLGRLERARYDRERFSRHPRAGELAECAVSVEVTTLQCLSALATVGAYLRAQPTVLVRAERARSLTRLANEAPTPAARIQYEEACTLLAERERALAEIEEFRALVRGKLEAMMGLLENLPVELMKLEVGEGTDSVVAQDGAAELLAEELRTVAEASAAVSNHLCLHGFNAQPSLLSGGGGAGSMATRMTGA